MSFFGGSAWLWSGAQDVDEEGWETYEAQLIENLLVAQESGDDTVVEQIESWLSDPETSRTLYQKRALSIGLMMILFSFVVLTGAGCLYTGRSPFYVGLVGVAVIAEAGLGFVYGGYRLEVATIAVAVIGVLTIRAATKMRAQIDGSDEILLDSPQKP
jgi:hypothetical protein